MAEQFQGGVCGGNWWINPSTNLFRSSPCSSAINDSGSFGWPNHEPIIDMKIARSVSDDSASSASAGSGSIVLQDVQKPSDENVSIASTLQMMGINLSSSTTTDDNWNQDLHHDNIGRSEQNYSNHMLQATSGFINSSMDYGQNSSINSFRQENQNFPFNSASYGYNSTLLKTLFDTDSQSTNYLSSPNYMNSTEFCPSLTKASFPKQQPANNNLQFTNSNNTPFWTSGASNFLPSIQPQLLLPSSLNSANPNLHSLSTKQHKQEAGGLNSVAPKKVSNEPPFKRPRIETPSPLLPTFKVRKERLGDRITALQQLVSPFGKTDTASVLHEAIEYIKFLHDQVSVLRTPYLKNVTPQLQHQQGGDKIKDEKGQIQDLRSRGLCLVPISSTFPVAAETTTNFWSPTFGGCFR